MTMNICQIRRETDDGRRFSFDVIQRLTTAVSRRRRSLISPPAFPDFSKSTSRCASRTQSPREQSERGRNWDLDKMILFVQFPLYHHPTKGTHWHLARETLRRVHERVPDTGMAVTCDFSDPGNVHPPEKQEVGRRLALWALADTYGREIVPSGPLVERVEYDGSRAVVSFRYAEGLRSTDGKPLREF